jgi:putative pyruvate formate lyase activating enzyme
LYSSCTLCPRRCGVDRTAGAVGYCGADSQLRLGLAYLHLWEEPCLSGTRGAGTVFFCHCSLRCVFCQNAVISGPSAAESGVLVTVSDLADTFLSLQDQGAHNIDLVTPTHYAPSVADAIALARTRGLTIPTVWNSSGYECVDTLRRLDGLIDIYLPDFKYYSTYYSERYSSAPDYFSIACDAIEEMLRQTGSPVFAADGTLQRGTILRHLMLPGLSGDTEQLLRYAAQHWNGRILFSLMRQFTPRDGLEQFPELLRKITDEEYAAACALMQEFGLDGWIQDAESIGESFIPVFDGRGIAGQA